MVASENVFNTVNVYFLKIECNTFKLRNWNSESVFYTIIRRFSGMLEKLSGSLFQTEYF